MKRAYTRPTVEVYGSVTALTLGNLGSQLDIVNGKNDPNGCQPPAGGTGQCTFTIPTS
jgi:hypothetical protein